MFGSSRQKKKGEESITQAGNTLYERSKATPDEISQYQGSFNIGKLLNQIYQYQAGVGQAPAGYVDPTQQYQRDDLNKALYGQILSQVQNPEQYYMNTLQPELQQAQDTINSYYQKRGLLNSGLAIEGMGRAGVDLAIKQAQNKMNFRQQALQNAQTLSQNIYEMGQGGLTNLSNLYTTQQQAGQNALSRQASAATQAAGYQAYPGQAALGSYYGGRAALQALPGQLIAAYGQAASKAPIAGGA